MHKEKIGYFILLALEKAADGYLALDSFSRRGSSVFYAYDLPKSNLSSHVSRLYKGGYVEKSINEGKIVLKLTEAGRDWVLKHGDGNPKNWDGVWRLVIFDIPEQHRRVRGILRRRLKEWGFVAWQKSVWASKKPLTDHLRKLVKDLGVEQWVLVIESGNVGRSQIIERSANVLP